MPHKRDIKSGRFQKSEHSKRTCIDCKNKKEIAKGFCRSCYGKKEYQRLKTLGKYSNGKFNTLTKEEKERRADRNRRNTMLKRSYGISLERYEELEKDQNGLCAICYKRQSHGMTVNLSVDHCHISGEVRGLLCAKCNTAIGMMEDDVCRLNSAITYLNKYV